MASMLSGHRRNVFAALRLPPHVHIVNLTAVPLSGQINRRALAYNRLLDDYGPHDGSLLIVDQLVDGAPTVTELGFDHFLLDPLVGEKSLALVRVLEELVTTVDETRRFER